MKYSLKKFSCFLLMLLISFSFEIFAQNNLIPHPPTQTDHRYASCLFDLNWKCTDLLRVPEKMGYLETILKNEEKEKFVERKKMQACGLKGQVEERIKDCKDKNGKWATFEEPKKNENNDSYEGEWNLVSVSKYDSQYEIWQDQKTKLLWSDKSQEKYNWFRATGYAKPTKISIIEAQFSSEPGVKETFSPYRLNFILQPKNPISVCVDVAELNNANEYGYIYQKSQDEKFKGPDIDSFVKWRVPSRADWMMAEVHGIRKVLPNMDFEFWSSTTGSDYRNSVWIFKGDYGTFDGGDKHISYFVRCVGLVRK